MRLSISWRQPTNQSMVLVLRGAIDYASAPELRAAISAVAARQPPPQVIVIDLSRVESIDDLGVGNRICRQIGIDLAVRNPSPLIRHLLGLGDTHVHRRRSRVASVGSG